MKVSSNTQHLFQLIILAFHVDTLSTRRHDIAGRLGNRYNVVYLKTSSNYMEPRNTGAQITETTLILCKYNI